MKSLNSTELIETIKRRASLPINQITFTDEDLLEMATEEMYVNILPRMLELHEDFYLTSEDEDLVADKNTYNIPYRAIGNKLRELSYVQTDDTISEMTRISVDDIVHYSEGLQSIDQYRTYYLQSNQIVIYPGVGSSVTGSLRYHYYLSPNALVELNKGGKITAIDRDTGVITMESFPTDFSPTIKYDFVMSRSPHRILKFDVSATGTNGTLKTVTVLPDDIPDDLAVDDYITKAGETVYPQIPREFHSLLAQHVAIACLESMNDTEGLKNATAKLQRIERSVPRLADNRVEASGMKVTSFNSILRNGLANKRRF